MCQATFSGGPGFFFVSTTFSYVYLLVYIMCLVAFFVRKHYPCVGLETSLLFSFAEENKDITRPITRHEGRKPEDCRNITGRAYHAASPTAMHALPEAVDFLLTEGFTKTN